MKLTKTSSTEKIKSSLSRPQLLGVMFGMVLAVAGLLYLGQRWLYRPQISDLEMIDSADTAIADAEALAAEADDPIVAIRSLKKYLATTDSKQNKYEVYMELGRLYMKDDNYGEALKAYQDAEQTDPKAAAQDISLLTGMAQSAELNDNKDIALDYYQRIIAILEADDSKTKDQKSFLKDIKSRVTRLEGAK